MKKRMQKITSVVLCGICCITLLGGCAAEDRTAENAGAGKDTEASVQNRAGNSSGSDSIGEVDMKDITGVDYTEERYADYDVTMVNVFTTWCTPCINEIPDLEKLRNEMSDQGVNVVGIVLDAVDGSGSVDNEAVEKAELLAENTGVTYPFLIPDDTLLNGRLYGINAVPETFFVDREGNVIGESYTGSRSLEEWKAVVEEKLTDVGGAAE